MLVMDMQNGLSSFNSWDVIGYRSNASARQSHFQLLGGSTVFSIIETIDP
jgi:hypothetical protein